MPNEGKAFVADVIFAVMSTQDDSGISFEICKEQQNFRLLELPPSLLALIVSKDPPKYVLTLDACGTQNKIWLTCPRVCG